MGCQFIRGTHFYTWVEKDIVRVKCLVQGQYCTVTLTWFELLGVGMGMIWHPLFGLNGNVPLDRVWYTLFYLFGVLTEYRLR